MKKIFLSLFVALCFSAFQASAQTAPAATAKTGFSIADSASFTGKYKMEGVDFDYVTVTVSDNKLYFEGGQYNGILEPIADKKDSFDVGGEAVFNFVRNAANKIIELRIDYQGRTFVGKKEEKKQ